MHKNIFTGLSALFGCMVVISSIGYSVCLENEDSINNFFNIKTEMLVNEEDSKENTLYYPSAFGDGKISDENFLKLQEETLKQGIHEEEEGAVLLYNPKNVLPLKNETYLNVLGYGSANPMYKSSSAGNYVYDDSRDIITLKSALESNGFTINDDLYSALKATNLKRNRVLNTENNIYGFSTKGWEEPISFYSEWENKLTNTDCALITLTRFGGEGTDLLMSDSDDEGGKEGNISSLSLHKNEKDLMEFAHNHFKKVIVLLNAPNPMEIEEIKPYCDAILAIGEPGLTGFMGVSNILRGKVSPSGRLADTYAENSLSAPATITSGTNSKLFANATDIVDTIGKSEKGEMYSIQSENIYVGYKYYETRYEDSVLNRFNASSDIGSKDGSEWKYEKEISYPFGYGLSYTTFEEKILSFRNKSDTIEVDCEVKNTGNEKGKHTLLLFGQTPYGQYEMDNDVEKSAIQLLGFTKSKELEPNESQKLTISFDKYFLASYDANKAKTYIISQGTNYLSLGKDGHEALNKILLKKGASSLVDEEGNPFTGDDDDVISFETSFDNEKYQYGENNTKVTNQFDDCDINYWSKEKYKYLSRKDWKDTFPKNLSPLSASEEMMKVLSGSYYEKPDSEKIFSDYSLGIDKGMKLIDMKDVPYDSKLWDDFIYQMSLDDLANVTSEGFTCPGIKSIAQPSVKTGDGMDSLGTTYEMENGDIIPSMTYACKNILTCTYNTDLYQKRGELMGEESLFTHTFENFCIGPNLHRTPFGGRNFEYMSEDATLTYLASIPEVQAMEKKGVHAAPKHFAGNDQESYREGIAVFFNEQAFRENDLRAFEGSLRVAKAGSVMQSFERVGMVFASSNKKLNYAILRNEWGFHGNVVTDATYGASKGYKGHINEIIDGGSDQFCLDGSASAGKKLVKYIKDNEDTYLLKRLLVIAKDYEYSLVKTNIINGLSSNSTFITIIPWWKPLMISLISSFSFFFVLFLVIVYLPSKKHNPN